MATAARPLITIAFRFREIEDEADLVVTSPVGERIFPISSVRTKAATLARELPGILVRFQETVGQSRVALTPELGSEAMAHLDHAAWQVAAILFSESNTAGGFIPELETLFAPLFRVMAEPPGRQPIVIVEASATDPLARLFPFEILPVVAPLPSSDAPLVKLISPFLGFRAPVVRRHMEGKRLLHRKSNGRIKTRLLLSRDQSLPGVQAQRSFFAARNTDFDPIEWPRGSVSKTPYRDLADEWLGDGEVVHLSCHYRPRPHDMDRPAELDFGGKCTVSIAELNAAIIKRRAADDERPFVFLNACNTASAPVWESSLLALLDRHRYCDFVGSRCLLPDKVAALFAERLYEALLSDDLPGAADAIVIARNKLVEDCYNPAGILYTHYGSPDLRVEPRPPQPTIDARPPRSWWSRLFGLG